MGLTGIFAAPPSGSESFSGTKKKPKGIFSEPPPAIDPVKVQHDQLYAQAQADAQIAAANAKHASSFGGFLKNAASAAAEPFVQGFKDAQAGEKPKSFNPITMAKDGARALEDSFAASLNDAGDKISTAASIFSKHPLVATGEIGLAALGPIFTAATAPLTYATAIPGIGHVADKVNEIFSAIGSGAGAHVATAYVDDNPYLSQETKDTIRPLVHDAAALVAQLALGKAGGAGIEKLGSHTKAILGAVSKDIKDNPPSANPAFQAGPIEGTLQDRLNATATRQLPVFGDTTLRKLPITDETPDASLVPNQAAYTAPDALPTIDMGRGRTDLPTIRYPEPDPNRVGPYQYEAEKPITTEVKPVAPIKPGSAVPDFSIPPEQHAAVEQPVSRETAPAPAATTLPAAPTPVETPGPVDLPPITLPDVPRAVSEDRGTPKLSSNVESKAIAQNLARDFGDLPQYDKVNWEDQAAKAQQLLSEDPARAHRIALGSELPPDGLLHGAVFDAVERRAFKNGDVHTVMRLSRDSTLGAKASRYGQEIGVLAMRDTGSPVKTIDAIRKTRTEAFEKKTGKKAASETKKAVNEIKDEVRKAASNSRQSWEDFMSNLTCNI